MRILFRARLALLGLALLMVFAGAAGTLRGPAAHAAESAEAGTDARLRQLFKDGRYTEAETVARELLKDAEARSGPASLEAAHAIGWIVSSLRRQGRANDPEVRVLAERSLTIKQEILGPDHIEVGRSLSLLGNITHDQGGFQEGLAFHERALEVAERHRGKDHKDLAPLLNNVAVSLTDLARYEEAEAANRRALALWEKAGDQWKPQVAMTLANLATVVQEAGDLAAARGLHEQAIAMREELLGPGNPAVGRALNSLAELLVELGDEQAARAQFDRAIGILEAAPEADRLALAIVLHNYARALERWGDLQAAGARFSQSLAYQEGILGPEHPDVARNLHLLALLQARQGDRPAARANLERALALREKRLGPDHPIVAETLKDLAELEERVGALDAAAAALEKAAAIIENALGPEHHTLAAVLEPLARLEFRRGRRNRALDLALRVESIARSHFLLTVHALSEREALRYEAIRASGLDIALTIVSRDGGTDAGGTDSRRVWDAVARDRALVLDEMAARYRQAARPADGGSFPALASLARLRTQLARLIVRGPGQEGPAAHRALVDQVQRDTERAERELAATAGTRAGEALRRPGLDQVLSALPDRTALVAYVTYRDHSRAPQANGAPPEPIPSYLAIVRDPQDDRIAIVPLGTAATIETLVRQWRTRIGVPPGTLRTVARRSEEAYRRAGTRLRDAIWSPLESRLEGARQILVVPAGAIHLVNLASFPDRRSGFLIETAPPLHSLAAERDVLGSRDGEPQGRGLLVFGGIDFDRSSAPPRAPGHPTALRGAIPACTEFSALRFRPLPGTEVEARGIAALWAKRHAGGAGEHAALFLTGAEAAEESFKRDAPGRRILHLATHGFFLEGRCRSRLPESLETDGSPGPGNGPDLRRVADGPLQLSGLAFAGANRRAMAPEDPGRDDGILTAEEISALDLSATEWAVLSACETGLGRIETGEGVFGLRRAFQAAGVRTLIMSLWPVEDSATADWMHRLYDARFAGRTTSGAVREATLGLLAARRAAALSSHPFYWAAFVATGDWR